MIIYSMGFFNCILSKKLLISVICNQSRTWLAYSSGSIPLAKKLVCRAVSDSLYFHSRCRKNLCKLLTVKLGKVIGVALSLGRDTKNSFLFWGGEK